MLSKHCKIDYLKIEDLRRQESEYIHMDLQSMMDK